MRSYLRGVPTGATAFTQGAMDGYGFVDGAIRDRATDEQTGKDREQLAYERQLKRDGDARKAKLYAPVPAEVPGLVADPGVGPAPVTSQSVVPAPSAAPVQPGLSFETIENRGSLPPATAPGLQRIEQGAAGAVAPASFTTRPAIVPEGGRDSAPNLMTQPGLQRAPSKADEDVRRLRYLEAHAKRAREIGGEEGFQMEWKLHQEMEPLRASIRDRDLASARVRAKYGDYSGLIDTYNNHVRDGLNIQSAEPMQIAGPDGNAVDGLRIRTVGANGQAQEQLMPVSAFVERMAAIMDPKNVLALEASRAADMLAEQRDNRKAKRDYGFKMDLERLRQSGQLAAVPQGSSLVRMGENGQAQTVLQGTPSPTAAAAEWQIDEKNNRRIHKATGEVQPLRDAQGRAATTTEEGGAPPLTERVQMSAKLGVPVASTDPYVGMSQKSAEKMRERLYIAATKRADELDAESQAAKQMAADAARFLALQTQTGGWQQGPLAAKLPGLSDAAQEMDAITARIAPSMRQPGSGATSDFDAKMFQRSTVDRSKSDTANAAIAAGIKARAEVLEQRGQFVRDYLSVNGHLDGADRQWKHYLDANPIFDPNSPNMPKLNGARESYQQFFGRQRGSAAGKQSGAVSMPKPGAVINGWRFKGGNPKDQANWVQVS